LQEISFSIYPFAIFLTHFLKIQGVSAAKSNWFAKRGAKTAVLWYSCR